MRVDSALSAYSERVDAREQYDRDQMEHMRFLLRRLQFLEHQLRERGDVTGGAVFAQAERNALEWVLEDMEFIDVVK